MPAFPKRGKAVCRSGEGIKSNRIMFRPSNRWHFVGSLLSSLSAVCRRADAAAVRTLREAPLPQQGNGRTSKQELAARTRSRRWTWAFCVLSNWPARKFSARPIPSPLPPSNGSQSRKTRIRCGASRGQVPGFRTESLKMNRRDDIFDSCALAGWTCLAKVFLPATLRCRSGHDRGSLMGYVRRVPPQPGVNTTHANEL
jgi:hypothetical protein